MQLIHIATKIAILQPNIGVTTWLDPSSGGENGVERAILKTKTISSVSAIYSVGLVANKQLQIWLISSVDNLADGFTKLLPIQKLQLFRSNLNLEKL